MIMAKTIRFPNAIQNNVILTLVCLALLLIISISAQDASIKLEQGTIVGLKVFPEASRIPVFSYLGIPYAQPPLGNLRSAPPKPHSGWNGTLYARNYQAICPQPDNSVYEEMSNGFLYKTRTSEDGLYLNIWTPETGLRYGNTPVLCIITGEEMAFDWTRNRPNGLDLASEGIVVVTVQSRTNVFGANSTKELLLRKTISHKMVIARIKYWAHVLRRPDGHVLRNALEYVAPGKNKVGRPCHTYNDLLNHALKSTGRRNWTLIAQDRPKLNRQCLRIYDQYLTDDKTTDSDSDSD